VLATVFSTGGGRFRLTDLMPVERLNQRHEGEDIGSHYRVLRLIEGLSGEAEVEVSFRPTFDYARAEATFQPYDGGIVARSGREALALSCPAPFREDASGGVAARFKVAAGQRVWVALAVAIIGSFAVLGVVGVQNDQQRAADPAAGRHRGRPRALRPRPRPGGAGGLAVARRTGGRLDPERGQRSADVPEPAK